MQPSQFLIQATKLALFIFVMSKVICTQSNHSNEVDKWIQTTNQRHAALTWFEHNRVQGKENKEHQNHNFLASFWFEENFLLQRKPFQLCIHYTTLNPKQEKGQMQPRNSKQIPKVKQTKKKKTSATQEKKKSNHKATTWTRERYGTAKSQQKNKKKTDKNP